MKRILYVDYLKALAIVGIIVIHLSSKYITHTGLNSSMWSQGLFIESMVRFSIILFIMASGVLLLNKKQDITDLPRRLKRILVPFIGWFIIYFIIKMSMMYSVGYMLDNFIYLLIRAIFDPTILSVQFWFVYMVIGLYLALPILSVWINSANIQQIEYFLFVWFITLTLNMLPFKIKILEYLGFFGGFIGYFILGYYLSIKELDILKNRKIGFLLYVAGTLLTFSGVAILTNFNHTLDLTFMRSGDLTINACIQAIGVFIIVKNTDYSKLKTFKNNIINEIAIFLSISSFGIYLSNILLINFLEKVHIYSISITPIINIPIFTIIIIGLLSAVLVMLDNIPVLNKLAGIKK